MHTSLRGIERIPTARVAIWWQAVGGGEDESCQWRPLKRTTHSPVTGEAWWMIISRCDRCCDGGGALALRPSLPPSLCLSLPLSAYLGQCFNTPLTWLYWHTPDSVWWLMSIWVAPSLFFLSLSAPHLPILFTVRAVQSGLSHTQAIRAWAGHTHASLPTHFTEKTHEIKIYFGQYIILCNSIPN